MAWGEVFPRYLLLSQTVGLRMRWGKQQQSYSTLVSNSQYLALSFPYVLSNAIISDASIIWESFHHLWTQKHILNIWEKPKLFKEFRLSGPDLLFFSLAFSLGKVVASQGFQVIPHAYRFIDMTFGYLFTSLMCGPQGPLWSVLQSSAFDVMGLAFWALWFTWYKPVDLQLK